MPGEYIIVFVTVPDSQDGARIGRTVVKEGLAACCNVIPGLRSIYVWKGELNDEAEVLCVFKTRSKLFEPLKSRIKELHGYEVPEIIAVDIKEGLTQYLDWISASTSFAAS